MTTEEKALDYLNQFKACKSQDLGKPFTGQDSGMGFILVYMYHNVKEVTQKELAEKMNVSKARITSLVQKMIEKGLVTRKTSKEDERVNIISLTDKGNVEGEKLLQYSLKIVLQLIDEIGTDEIDRFINVLLKIKDVLLNVTPCLSEEE
jgi:DNA-binding MarR family transcriptional regulator